MQLLAGASSKNLPNMRNLAMELRKVCCHPVSPGASWRAAGVELPSRALLRRDRAASIPCSMFGGIHLSPLCCLPAGLAKPWPPLCALQYL